MIVTLIMSMVIGLLLGLLGGGGSILTVPMLVYLFHVEPKNAIVTSFVVVGLSSLMALITHAKRGSVCWKSGLLFGITGMIGAFAGGRLAVHFSADVLMTLFGGICLVTGIFMMRNRKPPATQRSVIEPLKVCPVSIPYLRILFDGFFVGALTGMVGVGGGFLIVPALTLLVGFPIKGAVGTSLLIIAMNAVAGLAGYSQHVSLDLELTVIVASGTLLGSLIGSLLSAYIKPDWLRRVFGVMVVLVAGYILYHSVTVQLMTFIDQWFVYPNSLKWVFVMIFMLQLLARVGQWIHKADAEMFLPVEHAQGR